MKLNKRDTFYIWYFILHIPITILIDSCLIIPPNFRHSVQQTIVDFHISLNKDFLLQNPPFWLQVFGFFEIFLQLPIFFIAAYQLYFQRKQIHVVLTLYGFNASFTTAVCLAYVLKTAHLHGLSFSEKWNLFALYTPYFLIPGFMMVDSGLRLSSWVQELSKLKAKHAKERRKSKTSNSKSPVPVVE